MAIIIQSIFASAVEKANNDVFTRSYIEGRNTIIEFDMTKRDYKKIFGINSRIYWKKRRYSVDIHEFSTVHNPIVYRFRMSQGYYFDEQGNRVFFTPEIPEVSTRHHMSMSVIRLACFLAVLCGVSLRNIAMIYQYLFQIPVTKSTINRWIDEIGDNLPSEEEILKELTALKMPTQCHLDAYYPLGTDRCVMIIKDEYDRILISHETQSENAEDAVLFLKKIKDMGLNITSVFSDYSKSFMNAAKEVFPDARLQADHFHTAKNIWKHLKKSLLEYRKALKANGKKENNQMMVDLAAKLWKMRWSLLKKPSHLTAEEKAAIEDLEKKDSFIRRFRSVIQHLGSLFDYSSTEHQAEVKMRMLKNQIQEMEDSHLTKICTFLENHWHEAMQYLRQKGLGKYRRSSNSESGMRILRRMEKNHDGIRSERTRKNYIKIYQMIKYLSRDVTDFLDDIPLEVEDEKNSEKAYV